MAPSFMQSQITDLATSARNAFLACLNASNIQGTAGSCLYGAVLVQGLIRYFTPHQATVRGGNGGNEGFRDSNGLWHGHYWVEVSNRLGKAYVVDITGDQFGDQGVSVAPL
jgi:hypothetical protein